MLPNNLNLHTATFLQAGHNSEINYKEIREFSHLTQIRLPPHPATLLQNFISPIDRGPFEAYIHKVLETSTIPFFVNF